MPVWLLKLATSRLTYFALGAVVIVGIIALQTHRLHAAQAKVESLQTELQVQVDQVKAAVAANETNQQTIQALQEQNQSIIAARKLDEAKAAALIAQREDEAATARAAAASERKKRSEVWNASQSCQALAVTRVDDVCGPIADRLRERTAHGAVN